ncbi:hypothetical protein Tco_0374334 [Tanacetum coccineum]
MNRPSSKQVPKVVSSQYISSRPKQELDLLFGPLYDEFFTAGTNNGVAASFQQSPIHYHMLMLKLQRHAKSIKDIKNQEIAELKDKERPNSVIKDLSSKTKLRGRLLARFQDDPKYEHVGQDTRSQDGKEDQDKQGKYLKISKLKTKSKDNDKGSDKRSHNMKEQAYNIIKTKDSRTQ